MFEDGASNDLAKPTKQPSPSLFAPNFSIYAADHVMICVPARTENGERRPPNREACPGDLMSSLNRARSMAAGILTGSGIGRGSPCALYWAQGTQGTQGAAEIDEPREAD